MARSWVRSKTGLPGTRHTQGLFSLKSTQFWTYIGFDQENGSVITGTAGDASHGLTCYCPGPCNSDGPLALPNLAHNSHYISLMANSKENGQTIASFKQLKLDRPSRVVFIILSLLPCPSWFTWLLATMYMSGSLHPRAIAQSGTFFVQGGYTSAKLQKIRHGRDLLYMIFGSRVKAP